LGCHRSLRGAATISSPAAAATVLIFVATTCWPRGPVNLASPALASTCSPFGSTSNWSKLNDSCAVRDVGYDDRAPMGSVAANLRNAFIDLIEDETPGPAACALALQLLGSDDVLPYEYCEMLGVPSGSTFGAAAFKVRADLGCEG
jgi:hypothetical protein